MGRPQHQPSPQPRVLVLCSGRCEAPGPPPPRRAETHVKSPVPRQFPRGSPDIGVERLGSYRTPLASLHLLPGFLPVRARPFSTPPTSLFGGSGLVSSPAALSCESAYVKSRPQGSSHLRRNLESATLSEPPRPVGAVTPALPVPCLQDQTHRTYTPHQQGLEKNSSQSSLPITRTNPYLVYTLSAPQDNAARAPMTPCNASRSHKKEG